MFPQPLVTLCPADLKMPPGQLPPSSASMLGALSLPATQRLPDRSVFNAGASALQKLPYHTATGGALPVPPVGVTSTTWMGGAATARTAGEALLRLWGAFSQEEVYSFDVPPGVRTGLDAVKLFSSSAAKPGLIIFCGLNPAATVRHAARAES